jgi:hypothetical protein
MAQRHWTVELADSLVVIPVLVIACHQDPGLPTQVEKWIRGTRLGMTARESADRFD